MIFQDNLDAFATSCIPIITKVKPEKEKEADSLNYTRQTLDEQLQQYIKTQLTQSGGPIKEISTFSTPNPDDADKEKMD